MRQPDVKDIDTHGFPYVLGIPQKVYKSLLLPKTEKECIEQLTRINHIIKDIKLQLKLAEIEKKANDIKWQKSAIKKQQLLTQQKVLLLAQKEFLNNKPKKDSQNVIQVLFSRVDALTNKNKKMAAHVHQVALKSENTRSVLLALIQAIETNTVDEFIAKNSEALSSLKEATLREGWGVFKRI